MAAIRNDVSQDRVRVVENAEKVSVFFAHTTGILCRPFVFRLVIEHAEQKAKVQEQEKKMIVLEVQLRLCSLFLICIPLIIFQGWRI